MSPDPPTDQPTPFPCPRCGLKGPYSDVQSPTEHSLQECLAEFQERAMGALEKALVENQSLKEKTMILEIGVAQIALEKRRLMLEIYTVGFSRGEILEELEGTKKLVVLASESIDNHISEKNTLHRRIDDILNQNAGLDRERIQAAADATKFEEQVTDLQKQLKEAEERIERGRPK